jgi:hypothetical protein
MHELHLRYLEARRVGEGEPLGAAEAVLRARKLARLHVRVRAGPRGPRHRPELELRRARKARARAARVW